MKNWNKIKQNTVGRELSTGYLVGKMQDGPATKLPAGLCSDWSRLALRPPGLYRGKNSIETRCGDGGGGDGDGGRLNLHAGWASKTFLPVVGLVDRGWPFGRPRCLENRHQNTLWDRATAPADPETPKGWGYG